MLSHILKTVVVLCLTFFVFYPLGDKFNTKYGGNEIICKNKLYLNYQKIRPELKNVTSRVKRIIQGPQNHTNDPVKQKDSRDSKEQKDLTDFLKESYSSTILKRYDRDDSSKPEMALNYLEPNYSYHSSEHMNSENFSKNLKQNFLNPSINNCETLEVKETENKCKEDKRNVMENKYLSINRCEKENSIASYSKIHDMNLNRTLGKTYANVLKKNLPHLSHNITKVLQERQFKNLELPHLSQPHLSQRYSSIFDKNSPQLTNAPKFSSISQKTPPEEPWSNQPALRCEKTQPDQTHYSLFYEKTTPQESHMCQFPSCVNSFSQMSYLKQFSSTGEDTHPQISQTTHFSSVFNGTQPQSLQISPIRNNIPQSLTLPSIQCDTESTLPVKSSILVAITSAKKNKNDKKTIFTSITVGNEEIYKERDYLQFIKIETHSFEKKKYSDESQYKLNTMMFERADARRYARKKMKGTIVITFASLKIINTLNTEHPVADIRDIYCLSKFIDVIAELRRKKFEYTTTLKELTNYFLGVENPSLKNSTYVANAVKSIYNRFKNDWETEIEHLLNNGKLYQTLSPSEGKDYHFELNISEQYPYTGFHCDIFEYKLLLLSGPKNHHFFSAIDVEWNKENNEILHVTKVINSGERVFHKENLKINTQYYNRFQQYRMFELTTENCRFITVGHGILKSMEKIIGPNITSYENVIDLQLQFYLRKKEPMDNTLNYLVEKYLHIIVPKEPDSYMRAKMCMQLYKLYRFELGVDELWYGELIKSKKNCFE